MRAEMEEKVIPMIDANRLNKAAIGAAAVSQYYSPTANKPYEDVLKMSAALDESKAPQSGRVQLRFRPATSQPTRALSWFIVMLSWVLTKLRPLVSSLTPNW